MAHARHPQGRRRLRAARSRPTRASGWPSCWRTRGAPVLLTAGARSPARCPAAAPRCCCLDADARGDRRASRRDARRRGATPDEPRLRHLHLGLDRPAQGRGGHATRNVARLFAATDAWFGFGAERRLDAVPLVRLRLLGLGALGRARSTAAGWWWCRYWVSRSPEAFHELLARRARDGAQPDALGVPPAACAPTAALGGAAPELALRCVIFGGEALDLGGAARPGSSATATQRPRLVNMYGITETTVHVTYRPIGRGRPGRGPVERHRPADPRPAASTCSTRAGSRCRSACPASSTSAAPAWPAATSAGPS